MTYSTPKLHSFGNNVKHGTTCDSGTGASAACACCGSLDQSSSCVSTGSTATSCSTTGNKPGDWCGTGNAVRGHSCFTGNGVSTSSSQ